MTGYNVVGIFLFQSFNFTGLTPYTLYMVSIKVFNDAGEGPEVVRAVRTEEDGMSTTTFSNTYLTAKC